MNLSVCTWNASDILVMSPVSKGGQFRVVEAIQGDTPIGTVVTLAELAPPDGEVTSLADVAEFADIWSPRFRRDLEHRDILPAPPMGTLDRVIVFLRRPGVEPEYTPGNVKADTVGWQPANWWGDLRTSAIWLQDGEAYGYGQNINPGPSHLMRWKVTEEQVRAEIREVQKLRAAMDQALGNPSAAARRLQLVELVRSSDRTATASALQRLERNDEGADALEQLLLDPTLMEKHRQIVWSLQNIHATIHLARILEGETFYWGQKCRELPMNWIQSMSVHDPTEWHYALDVTLLAGVPTVTSAQDRTAVEAFAQAWSTCPVRDTSQTVEPLSQSADRLLHPSKN